MSCGTKPMRLLDAVIHAQRREGHEQRDSIHRHILQKHVWRRIKKGADEFKLSSCFSMKPASCSSR